MHRQSNDRISLEFRIQHEARPFCADHLAKNHQKLKHSSTTFALSDASKSSTRMLKICRSFFIWAAVSRNEASGANAGLLIAYHLAAAQGGD